MDKPNTELLQNQITALVDGQLSLQEYVKAMARLAEDPVALETLYGLGKPSAKPCAPCTSPCLKKLFLEPCWRQLATVSKACSSGTCGGNEAAWPRW
jgi:hypothetical protein